MQGGGRYRKRRGEASWLIRVDGMNGLMNGDYSLKSNINGLFEGLDWISAESVIYRAQHLKTMHVFHIRKSPHARDRIYDGANIRAWNALLPLARTAWALSVRRTRTGHIGSGAVRLDPQPEPETPTPPVIAWTRD